LWIGGIAALIVAVLLAPWAILFFAYLAQDISNRFAVRHYQPTSLADAVAWKHATPEIIARFIDAGEDVNQRVPAPEPVKSIPLVAEASGSGNVEVTRLLLRRGASIDDAHLWYRAREGNEAMARMLIEEGASLGSQLNFQESIGPELLQAAFGGQAWLVQLIAQKGAGNVQMVNARGEGLLALALSNDYHDTVGVTRALLAAGAHVNPVTAQETSPLYWAAHHGKLKELDLLLAAGAP
jgi:ankyrin repeat protein